MPQISIFNAVQLKKIPRFCCGYLDEEMRGVIFKSLQTFYWSP